MVLSQRSGSPVGEGEPIVHGPDLRAGATRLRVTRQVVVAFAGAALVSAELFAHAGDGGNPFLIALAAMLPLQAVALIWLWSQRRGMSRSTRGPGEI